MRLQRQARLGVVVDQARDGFAQGFDALAGPGRDGDRLAFTRQTFGLTQHGLAHVGVQQVGLVPDLEDAASLAFRRRNLLQHRLDVLGLSVAVGRGDVADVQDQVSLAHLFQGGAETLDQFVRQV
ncbi:hypothetical protein D3C85_1123620 [compost metagenome]